MANTSPTESATENEKSTPEEGRKSRRRRAGKLKLPGSSTGGLKSRWPTLAALVIALIAVGIAVVAWVHPLHGGTSSQTFNDEQTANAKKNVCTAYTTVKQAVVGNTHLKNPGGDNPIGTLAVAANARLSLLGGGVYLRDRLSAEPATPDDLSKALNTMADTLEELGINYLAGASYLVQDPLRDDLNMQIAQVDKLCS